jgi:hypothetical protein
VEGKLGPGDGNGDGNGDRETDSDSENDSESAIDSNTNIDSDINKIAIMTMIAIPDSYAVLICKRAPILPVPRRQTADVRAVVVITEGGEILPTIVSIAEGNL